ncbi:MAG: peptidylprolyl isomerase [Bryobacteraceae bacterium]|nr:peptidylprolyl isomerase [Bryobacteraceae bacterium]
MIALFLLALAADPRVVMETSAGEIEVVIQASKAPITAANFLRYVKEQRYDQGRFHRSVRMDNQPQSKIKIEVIQAGPAPGTASFPAITLERTSLTGLKHKDGVISMARSGPDTATADFFICIGDQPSLDFGGLRNPDGQGFAAFGYVVRGMDVVKRIQQLPVTLQKLTPPIEIRRIRVK